MRRARERLECVRSRRRLGVVVDLVELVLPRVLAGVPRVPVRARGAAVVDFDTGSVNAGRQTTVAVGEALEVVAFQVPHVQGGLGGVVDVAPELEGVAAGLRLGHHGLVDAFQVEHVAGCHTLVVAVLDAGADGDVVGVEGEAVVGECAGLVGVPEVGGVESGACFGVGVPGEVLADFPDCALEVVVVDGAADGLCLEAGGAAVVGGEAPPEDVLGAVDAEADAAGVGGGDVAAVDVEVAGVVQPDGVDLLGAGVDELDAGQVDLGGGGEAVLDGQRGRCELETVKLAVALTRSPGCRFEIAASNWEARSH